MQQAYAKKNRFLLGTQPLVAARLQLLANLGIVIDDLRNQTYEEIETKVYDVFYFGRKI